MFTYKLLMRSKLSPDSSKLVISTQNGYIIVIHDLDLLTLSDDLKGFPIYGYPSSWQFLSRRSKSKRNRVELIKEWPSGDNASDIASLQVCMLLMLPAHSKATLIYDFVQDLSVYRFVDKVGTTCKMCA